MHVHLLVYSTSGHPFLVRQQNHHAGGYMQFLLIRVRDNHVTRLLFGQLHDIRACVNTEFTGRAHK